MTNNEIQWDWKEFCETGLNVSTNSSSITPCGQQIYIHLPTFSLLAIISSYNYGKLIDPVLRNNTQKWCLSIRALLVIVLAILPLIKLLTEMQNGEKIWPVDVLLACTEALCWTIHFAFLALYRKLGKLSHRGPLLILILYSCSLSLSVLWVQTNMNIFSELRVALNVFYALTLLPRGKSQYMRRTIEINEHEPLINTYHRLSVDGNEEDYILGPAEDGYNFLSRLIFYWVNPLIQKASAVKLKSNEDLFDLPESLNIKIIAEKLQRNIDAGKTLFLALHRSFGVEFYMIGILRLISDLSSFAGPLLLGALLRTGFEENDPRDEENYNAYYYAGGLFLTTLVSAIAGIHFNWKISNISTKMRTALVSTIYAKGLEAKGLHDAKPEILNLMSTDTDRIVNSCISFHSFWSIPFQLFATLYLLYTQLKFAFVPGVIFAIILIPINRYIAVKIGKLSGFLMTAKDKRVSLTTEALTGAKQIKLQAFEDIFIDRIQTLRKNEIVYLSKRKYLDAWCVYFWATTPVLMCLFTFGEIALTGQKLTASVTYTSVALLNLLIGPLNAFPWVLNGLMEAFVSLKRVQELIDLENIDLSKYYSKLTPNFTKNLSETSVVVSIKNGSFCFEKERDRTSENIIVSDVQDFKLENVNIEIRQGELVCIDGTVGSGKTALLNAILGNLKKTSGTVSVKDIETFGFGYVSQTSWLQRGTIRENICWGKIYDESRYQAVIKCCALSEDLDKLGGDNIGIGEGGRTLSGGQKLRVALARSLYQDKQIYIMDDILSALDAHVASHIVKYCIFGYLLKKTRIIVSHNKTLLEHANQIIQLDKGTVTCIDLMNEFDDELSDDELDFAPPSRRTPTQIEPDQKSVDSCLMEEAKEDGNISSSVIACYWKSMGYITGFFVIFCVFLMQLSRNITDGWLAHWVSIETVNSTNSSSTNETSYYLETYASLALGNSVLTLIRSFLFAYAGIKAAKIIHDKLLNKVFYTKIQFFDITPLGRILNRFSSDTYTIDDSLPFIFNILLAQLFGLLGSIFVSLYALPWLALIIAPMVPLYLDIQSKYRNASRDIKRISSNALSPLYAQFTETLQGLTTIRAMRASARFKQDFAVKLEESIRAQITASAASCWLSMRLQLLGAFIVGGAGIITAITSAHAASPGMVGLAISYALSISSLLSGLLNAFTETEQEMIAVERVNQYLDLPPEPNFDGTVDPPFGWPHQSVIKFKNVFMSYRENLIPAINGISFETASYERIGICGRTGAGKSSIINALLRVSNLQRGEILIDNVDIKTLPLNVLRSRVAVISQEPFLFEGTVRDNIDPRGVFLDSEIWNAIAHSMTSSLVQNLGGLYGKIEVCGSNLSAGQRQLLCLTRALLRSAKIVLIDEATSNLDQESELGVQIALKNAFKTATIFIIAHRLNGLQHTDRLFVINNGVIAEMGEFSNLTKDENTYLYQMLREQRSNLI
ncbi:hypothetical protein PVAND_005815 [Polypedilum vanderplanki]|uniref:ABC-type xenobiotic transporter n=1 Tax=Polypedilum vanderplanki TaxID=319348 RepID=A0A9J6C363_POLVA|nr:hypothetical protein PVAND_005815 [Polypedilum vanderplanki]